ncbi:hypothetical protein ACQBJO_14025 [Janibacter sp. G349]|uniref:hypothetical protein n=1 Tax=unclassified Janibacter TaxID=2649294 RepID=UPI003CFFE5F1
MANVTTDGITSVGATGLGSCRCSRGWLVHGRDSRRVVVTLPGSVTTVAVVA